MDHYNRFLNEMYGETRVKPATDYPGKANSNKKLPSSYHYKNIYSLLIEQSVQLLFIRQWNFDPFQMDQPKTRLIST